MSAGLWTLTVAVIVLIVYGLVVALVVKVQRQRSIFRDRPLPPQQSNVRVITQRDER